MAFLVWSWYDAPDELKALSRHGGDEDWIGLCPLGEEMPMWMECPNFGCCDVSEHRLDDGRVVAIGAHA